MSAPHQLELVYRDLRSLRQKVLDLDPMLPTDVTSRQLLHGLDEFEEELRILILQTFKPPSRYGSTAP
jgi:hypothetical protein